jgi:mono/diheme cytochrome c family protein
MPRRRLAIVAGCWVACVALATVRAAEKLEAGPEFFEKFVRPVLADNCFQCHGPSEHKGELRLDFRAAMLQGGETGPAIVPNNPEASLLITAVHYFDEPKMPPRGKLKPEQIEALSRWIKAGAAWPEERQVVHPPTAASGRKITAKDREFWSFRLIADPPVPTVQDTTWPKSSIDSFVLAKLDSAGLKPAAKADKRTLIRRATFDLIGLPPTPEEIADFLADDSQDAFARVVDRLLASPHYGERWARHWLDVARYGEDQAHTFEARKYPQGYRYRDWLVKSLNADMPYDEFLRQQIAADLIDGPDKVERLPALGFFALGPVYYGDKQQLDQIDDRIDTLSRGMLGLTVACARCHDHKFDPIPTRDYYALAGVFGSTEYVEVPLVSQAEVDAAKKALTPQEIKKKVPPKYPFIHALKEGTPKNMRVHIRGSATDVGEEAPRRFLCVLCPDNAPPFSQGSGRLELANAIASKDNPLTARVLVNRVWEHHFGKGLVRTPSNFGAMGERPTHPELLDHLATRFIQSGWSLKKLHRDILLSATWQQSGGWHCPAQSASAGPEHAMDVDPDNSLLWHMPPRRLEVEAWRDAMLAVSGTLDQTLGGPSTELSDSANHRRTLYGFISRHELNPLLRLFDFPDANITSDERTVTTVPLQQLFVLNSDFMVGNAKALAGQLTKSDFDDAARIRRAYSLLCGRKPTEQETRLGLDFLAAKIKLGAKLTRWEQYAQALLASNEFMFVD